MKVRKILAAVLILSALLPVCGVSAFAAEAPAVSAECAVVTDGSGTVLFEKNADRRMLIASTTKIMTALTVLENCDIYETVTVDPACVGVEGSSMYLKSGEKITVLELLYGLLLESGNDAAAALAYHVSGDIPKFADLMNKKAGQLGLKNTHFVNPHGLDAEDHYSTAVDLAAITAEAIKNDTFCRITSTKNVSVGGRYFKNHNKLLETCSGVFGGKTGYTKNAGRTLVSCCERDGLYLICVTINDPNDWDDHAALYDWAYGNFCSVKIAEAREVFHKMPVISGGSDTVNVVAETGASLTVPAGTDVKTKIILPKFVYAPISKGNTAGRIDVYVDGEYRKSVRLIYASAVGLKEKGGLNLFNKTGPHV